MTDARYFLFGAAVVDSLLLLVQAWTDNFKEPCRQSCGGQTVLALPPRMVRNSRTYVHIYTKYHVSSVRVCVFFCFVLFRAIRFCSVLFCFVLFCFVLFCFVLFCSVLFCSVRFYFRYQVCLSFCFVLFPFMCVSCACMRAFFCVLASCLSFQAAGRCRGGE